MKKTLSTLAGCLGVLLILHGRDGVDSAIRSHLLNPLELKGSPYGEIIGMALQEPVHLLWHGGKGHEHISGDGDECAVCGVDHADEESQNYLKDKPLSAKVKLKMLSMENAIRQDNSPLGRSAVVVSFERQRARDLMFYAYEMDPTNYGNYNAVSFFLEASGSVADQVKIEELAQKTLAACEGRVDDPSDCLTAASAAHILLVKKSGTLKHVEYYQLSQEFDLFLEKVKQFELSFEGALSDGRLSQYSQEKVDEMITHYNQFAYSVREYKKKIEEAKSRVVAPGVDFRFDKQPTR